MTTDAREEAEAALAEFGQPGRVAWRTARRVAVALRALLAEPHPDTARAEAAEAELAEAHTHFAIQGGRIREAQERAQAAEATLVELQPADVLVEGSWIPVAEWPTILGNFMRSSAEYAREAKALHARIAEALATLDYDANSEPGYVLVERAIRILKGES